MSSAPIRSLVPWAVLYDLDQTAADLGLTRSALVREMLTFVTTTRAESFEDWLAETCTTKPEGTR